MIKNIIITIIVLIVLVFVGLMYFSSTPLTSEEATERIVKLLEKEVTKNDTVSSGLVYIDSKEYNYRQSFAVGIEDNKPVESNQQFHIASVGKVFTATLIGTLIDDGQLMLTDPISDYLSDDVTKGLFIYEGIDYTSKVTIEMLLSHTSGVADYFDDEGIDGQKITEVVLNEPKTFFTPYDLLDFSRHNQVTIDKPGVSYHYSDTGYILLGLIIESVGQKSFDDMLHSKIFGPLGMNDTYLMFYSEPKSGNKDIADVWLEGVEISHYQSLSVDWAGGGVISTLDDLAVFIRAINHSEVISEETLNAFYQFDYEFMKGLHYGKGFMSYHFEEFFPTLKALPRFKGHMGILGTHMLYDLETDTVYISSFGSTDYTVGSMKSMIQILSYMMRIKE